MPGWEDSRGDCGRRRAGISRIGLAWQLTRQTLLRTGYGIFYTPQGVDRNSFNQTGFTAATTMNPSLDNGRAEFLNALNHTNLAAPNTNPINAAFGSVTASVGNQRSIVFGLKLVY